jgi:hypothetical protein
MLGNPRYRTVGLFALPSMLLFEALGPLIELSGYGVSIVALVTGRLPLATFALFLALAVLCGLLLTLGGIALEDVAVSSRATWPDLRRALLFALAESFGYRQMLLWWRLEGFWKLIRKSGWGAMERKGFTAPDSSAGG